MTLHVVTVVKDDPVGLTETLDSLHKKFPLTPVYVKIPSPADSAFLVAKTWQARHPIHIDSSADFGPFDAMNKALGNIPSDSVVWFINAGDLVSPACDAELVLSACRDSSFVWGFGQYSVRGNKRPIQPSPMLPYSLHGHACFRIPICHQAVLARVSAIRTVGTFDTSFSIAADYKLLLTLGTRHTPRLLETHLVEYRPGGISDKHPHRTVLQQRAVLAEFGNTKNLRPNVARDVKRLLRWYARLVIRRLLPNSAP